MYIIGLDIGTSSVKGVLVRTDGQVIDSYKIDNQVIFKKGNQAEQDPEGVWWTHTIEIIKKILKRSKIHGKDIVGIGCSGVFPAIVPINKEGKALRNAILYNIDKRSSQQIKKLNKRIDPSYTMKVSRRSLNYQSVMPKILWIKENESIIWKDIDTILDARGYLVFKMTGKKVIDYYSASHSGLGYHNDKQKWDELAFKLAGININIMPELRWPYSIAGETNIYFEELTGIKNGTSVITGTGDALAEMISAGINKEKETALLYGSTMPMMSLVSDKSDYENLTRSPSWKAHHYIVSSGVRNGMDVFTWFRKLLKVKNNIELFKLMNEVQYIEASIDELFIFPYFTPPINNKSNNLEGLIKGSLIGLQHHHDSRHVFKAILESLGFTLRMSMEKFPHSTNVKIIGGGTNSDMLTQCISNICNITQTKVMGNYGASLGVAWLVAYGLNYHDNDSLMRWFSEGEIIKPDIKKTAEYDNLYYKYKKIDSMLNKLYLN